MRPTPQPSEEMLEQAANWIARLHADDRSEQDEAHFKAWIAAHPDHGTAFEVMDRGWSVLDNLPRQKSRLLRQPSRRQLIMAGAGSGLVAVASLVALRPAAAQSYETGIGEQKHVTLGDGSKIFLNASTKLLILLTDIERRADLSYGRANFEVAADAKRPFIVSAGDRQIVSHGASFDVGRDGSDVQIVLTRGAAYFRQAPTAPLGQKPLAPGDRLVSSSASFRIDRPAIAPLVAWQTRRAIFDGDLLADAVREMNLYSQTKLEISDTRAANLRISGIYRVGDNPGFAHSIAKFLPIRVTQEGDRVVLHSAASNG